MRIGLACPYTWDVPGGVQVHVRDLAETPDPDGPRGLRHHPGRRRGPAAAVRGVRRQGHVGALQRLGHPDPVRAGVGVAGTPLDTRRRLRRRPCARADRAERQPARLPRRVRAARRDLPHQQPALAHPDRAARRRCSWRWRRSGPTSPSPKRPGAPSSSTSASTRCSSRTGSTSSAFAAATPLIDLASPAPTIVFVGRIDEPRKGLAVLLEALPAVVGRAARRPAAGRRPGRGRRGRRGHRPGDAPPRRSCSGWSATPTSRGCFAPPTSTWRPTPARRASASCCWRRWRPARPSSPATSTPSGGCWTTGAPGGCSPTGSGGARRGC